jgi:alkylation response protein AidB-like acyl-CoA dehydrogenase
MDFSLDEQQTQLRDSARRFIENDYGFEQRRCLVEHDGGFSARNWSRFAQMGWLGAGLPEAVGGFGGSAIETALIAEELGRGLVVEPFVAVAVLAAQSLLHAADGFTADTALGALIDGARLVVPALADADGLCTRVDANVDGTQCVTGRKALVVGGSSADCLLVSATEATGTSLLLLPAGPPGMTRHAYRLIDGTPACDLVLDAVKIDPSMRIGAPGGAAAALEFAQQHAGVAWCAQALGVMARAIETTRDYLLQRHQFGVAIASFQALRHRLADMVIAHEQARATLHGALAALVNADGPAPELARAVAIAKAQSGRSGRFIGAQAIQLHGGIGMTNEYVVGHCFKQLMVIDSMTGGTAAQLRALAVGMSATAKEQPA